MITFEIPEWAIVIICLVAFWTCICLSYHYSITDELFWTKCKKLYFKWRYPYSATGIIKVATKLNNARKYLAERREYASSIVDNPRGDFVFYVDNDEMAMKINIIDAMVARDTTIQFRFRKKEDLVQFAVRWL